MARMLLILVAIVVAAVAVVACSPIRALNALLPSDSYELATVAYGAGERRQLDVYTLRATAERVRPANGWPLVVFFYGGSWNHGERESYRFVGEAMAARGILTVIFGVVKGCAQRFSPLHSRYALRSRVRHSPRSSIAR